VLYVIYQVLLTLLLGICVLVAILILFTSDILSSMALSSESGPSLFAHSSSLSVLKRMFSVAAHLEKPEGNQQLVEEGTLGTKLDSVKILGVHVQ
jgi:hypothetical protein